MTTDMDSVPRLGDIVVLPGGDLVRTLVFVLLSVGVMFSIVGPLTPESVPKTYADLTTCLTVAAMGCAVISALWVHRWHTARISEVRHCRKSLYPKAVLALGVLMLFATICLWMFLLGGILDSPYSSLVLISPVFFVVEFIRMKDKDAYRKVVDQVGQYQDLPEEEVRKLYDDGMRIIKKTNSIYIIIVLLIVITITLGEYLISVNDAHLIKHSGSMQSLLNSTWEKGLTYTIYYVSALATFFTLLSPEATKNIVRRILL